jgi:hypothetical protein
MQPEIVTTPVPLIQTGMSFHLAGLYAYCMEAVPHL